MAMVAIGLWANGIVTLGICQEASERKFESVAELAAYRLKLSETEAAERAEELKQIHVEEFDKFALVMDDRIAKLVRHLAEYDRRAVAVARGVAAEGDRNAEQTKSTMKSHEENIRSIAFVSREFGPKWHVSRVLTANVLGVLRAASPGALRKEDTFDTRVRVEIDELGIDEAIPRLEKWRWDLEDKAAATEERLQKLQERLLMPLGYLRNKGPVASKVLAKLLHEEVLRDIDLSEKNFDEVMKLCHASNILEALKGVRWRGIRSDQSWSPDLESATRENAVIRALRADYTKANEIKETKARDEAMEAIKSEIRKRASELSAFERKIKRAEAIELEGAVYIMMRESRNEIIELLKTSKKSESKDNPDAAIDWKNARLAQLVADTVPRIQEVAQVARRCREVWLK